MKDVGEAHYVTSLLFLEGGVAALTLTGAWQMRAPSGYRAGP